MEAVWPREKINPLPPSEYLPFAGGALIIYRMIHVDSAHLTFYFSIILRASQGIAKKSITAIFHIPTPIKLAE